MDEETITLTRGEAERFRIIHQVLDRLLTQLQAGEILGITDRHVRNLLRRVKSRGARGLMHGNRGQASPRKMPEAMEERIAELIRTQYPDFGPLLASEKLAERHRIRVSREKIRQVMLAQGLWKRRRRKREDHLWRERKPRVGELVQLDGSHHAWLEGRGPKLVLMGYIDDATGRFYGRFYDYEGVFPAMDSLRGYLERYGLPLAIYLDKHSTYKTTRPADLDELLRGAQAETQFERALTELAVRVIHAHSPQAKGRVERIFETLQDRLVKEMRLAGIKSLEEANRFLPAYLEDFNLRFMKEPLAPGDLHRPLPKSVHLDEVLCLKGLRTINNGYVVRWASRMFVLTEPSLTLRRQKVVVLDRYDGRLSLRFKGRDLAYREVQAPRPAFSRVRVAKPRPKPPKYIPPPDHPWRHQVFGHGPV